MTTPADMPSGPERTPALPTPPPAGTSPLPPTASAPPPSAPPSSAPPPSAPPSSASTGSTARPPVRSGPTSSGPGHPRAATDRPHGALALLLLRLAVAAILVAHAIKHLQDLDNFKDFVATLDVPAASTAATLTPIAELVIAAGLVFGLAVRVAGLGLTALFVLIIFAMYRDDALFPDDLPGFTGELELLLAVCGLVFLLIGGGGWGLDKFFRSRHARARETLGRT